MNGDALLIGVWEICVVELCCFLVLLCVLLAASHDRRELFSFCLGSVFSVFVVGQDWCVCWYASVLVILCWLFIVLHLFLVLNFRGFFLSSWCVARARYIWLSFVLFFLLADIVHLALILLNNICCFTKKKKKKLD